MKILGITGGIGAGKSLVSQLFEKLGATVIDADVIARQVLEKDGGAYGKVVAAFGDGILRPDKTIDRKALAEIVFKEGEKLSLLNGIVHPAVFDAMEEQIQSAKTDLVCLDVPLLFSCDFPIACDKTLAVLAPKELRIKRVINRDNCTEEQALARMNHQLSDEEFKKRADLVVLNDGDEESLFQKVKEIYVSMTEILE